MLISSHTRDIKSFYHDQTVSITIRAISNHEFFSITSRLTNPKSANLDYFKPGLQASLFRFTEAQNVEAKPGKTKQTLSGVLSGADIQKSRSSGIVMVAGKYNNNNNNNLY